MRRLALIIACLITCSCLIAQTREFGLGFQPFILKQRILETNQLSNYNGPITSAEENLSVVPALGLGLTFHIPFVDRDGFSFGIQPGYSGFGMIRTNMGGFLAGGRGDVMLAFRKGSHASYANYVDDGRSFGVAIGGSAWSILNITDTYTDKLFIIGPSLAVDFGSGHSKTKLFFALWPFKSVYPSYTGDITKVTYWQFGVTFENWRYLVGE